MANMYQEEQEPQQNQAHYEQYDEFGQLEEGQGLPNEIQAQLPPAVEYGNDAEDNENIIDDYDYNQDGGPIVQEGGQDGPNQQGDHQNQQGDQNDLG